MEEELVPPDGGWGWLVLLAAVMVNLLIPGTIKSFGVLFVEFLNVFDASPAAAAWIPSLCYFLYSSLGKNCRNTNFEDTYTCFFLPRIQRSCLYFLQLVLVSHLQCALKKWKYVLFCLSLTSPSHAETLNRSLFVSILRKDRGGKN